MNRPSPSGHRKMRALFSLDSLAPIVIAAFVVLLVAVPVLDILDNRRFVARAESANGVVIDVVEYGGPYYPVVRFSTPGERGAADERSVQFEAAESAGDPSYYRDGDSVGVLYDPANPEDARLDTLRGRWGDGAPLLLPELIILLVCLGMAIESRRERRRLTPWGSYSRERFYPVPAEQTFSVLKWLVSSRFAVQQSVDSTMRISFDKGWSFWSSGENVSVRVVPDERGAVVRVEAASKSPGTLGEVGRLRKLVEGLFTDLANALGSEPTGGS